MTRRFLKQVLFVSVLPVSVLMMSVTTMAETLAGNEMVAAGDRTMVDQLGRQILVPDNPVRVISLAPSITEIVYVLEQDHRLVGATRFSYYPEPADKLPKVGSYIQLDLEKIVALKPDLCIAVKDGNPLSIVKRIEKFNIPVYAVDPRNLHAVMETLIEIGALLDSAEKAATLVEKMQNRIRNVTSRVDSVAHRPGVFFQIGISPIVSIGTDTFIHELIELAGGENLTHGPVPYPRFSVEQVLRLAPEVFIITSMARGGIFDRIKKGWQRWPGMPAVRDGRIYLVDSDIFDRATPRLVDGLETLARLLHPDRFRDME